MNVPFGQEELVVSSVEIETQSVKVNINKSQIDLPIEAKPKNIRLNEGVSAKKSIAEMMRVILLTHTFQ
jgi:hypothetical protein